jgi:hypothetical protein
MSDLQDDDPACGVIDAVANPIFPYSGCIQPGKPTPQRLANPGRIVS